jgi:hypothetical protein
MHIYTRAQKMLPSPWANTHRHLAPFRFVGKHDEGLVAATWRVPTPHPTRGLCTIYERRRLNSIYYIALCSVFSLYAIYISRQVCLNTYRVRVDRDSDYMRFMGKCYCPLRTRRGLAGSGQFF